MTETHLTSKEVDGSEVSMLLNTGTLGFVDPADITFCAGVSSIPDEYGEIHGLVDIYAILPSFIAALTQKASGTQHGFLYSQQVTKINWWKFEGVDPPNERDVHLTNQGIVIIIKRAKRIIAQTIVPLLQRKVVQWSQKRMENRYKVRGLYFEFFDLSMETKRTEFGQQSFHGVLGHPEHPHPGLTKNEDSLEEKLRTWYNEVLESPEGKKIAQIVSEDSSFNEIGAKYQTRVEQVEAKHHALIQKAYGVQLTPKETKAMNLEITPCFDFVDVQLSTDDHGDIMRDRWGTRAGDAEEQSYFDWYNRLNGKETVITLSIVNENKYAGSDRLRSKWCYTLE